MKIFKIYSYLSYPAKHADEQPEIGGANISPKGKLYEMLKGIFEKSDQECDISICFLPMDDGSQENECRNEIVRFIESPGLVTGRKIAKRLQQVTTGKSGMGLLFVILAKKDNEKKLMLSRFPADQGIMAEQDSKSLKIEFIEQVFLKNAKSYKSAIYVGDSVENDFWIGNAVDKQTNHGLKDIANYWIKEFLLSDFKTTSKTGTKRLALALRNAINMTKDLAVKHEITSAAVLAKNMKGKNITIDSFVHKFNLSNDAKELVVNQLGSSRLSGAKFLFDLNEFSKHLSYKTLEIDNGAILTAPVEKFNECFEELDEGNDEVRTFMTTGIVTNEKLRKSR